MRTNLDLRPTDERPATAGRVAVLLLRVRVLALASLALVAGGVALLTTEVGDQGRGAGGPFLVKTLGPAQSAPTLERAHPHGWTTTVGNEAGFGVARRGSRLSLSLRGAGSSAWKGYEHGVQRTTSFGRQTITSGPGGTEEYLTVERRQGKRSWTWDIGQSRNLQLRSTAEGSVFVGPPSDPYRFQIPPAAILDPAGDDITPAGLAWKVVDARRLELRLDDSKLPVPYVIDPAILFDVAANGQGHNVTSLTFNVTVATGHTNRLLVVGYNAENTTTQSCQPAGVTYNGTAMTLAARDVAINPAPNYDCVGLYYQLNPATGTRAVVINMGGQSEDGLVGGAVSLYNVYQSAPDTTATSQSAGLTSTTVATNWANQLVIDAIGPGDVLGNMAAGAGQTSRVLRDSSASAGSDSLGMSTFLSTGAGNRTMSWTRSPLPNRSAQAVAVWQSVDDTAPTHSLSLSESSPYTAVNGTTLYYNAQGTNSGTFTVTDAPTDNESGIANVIYPTITGLTGGGTDTGSPYTMNYDWTPSTTATGAQTVTATNRQTMTSNTTFTLVRDVTAPGGSPAMNANGTAASAGGTSSINATGTISVSKTDYTEAQSGTASGLAFSLLTRENGTLAGNNCSSYGAPTTVTITGGNDAAGPFATGCYRYTLTGTDNVGNVATLTTTVKVDRAAPSSTATFPAAGGNYNAAGWAAGCATAGFCGTAIDAETAVANVKVSIKRSSDNTYWNGAAWSGTAENLQTATGTTSWTYALAATNLTDGLTYTVHTVATDSAGNVETSSTSTFKYDTTAPTSATTFPASNGSYNAAGWAAGCATAGLCGTASDATSSLANVKVSIKRSSDNTYWNGSAWSGTSENLLTASGTTTWSYGLGAANLADGLTYTVHAVATDNAGNTQTSSTFTFKYDTTAPSSTTTFPTAGGSYNVLGWAAGCAGAGLCGTAADGTSGVANVKVSIKRSSDNTYWNGSAWSGASENLLTATGTTTWSYALAAANLADGLTYTVHVVATDNAGNTQTSSTFAYTYDATAPTSSATFPAAGASYNAAGWNAGCGSAGLCGTASDGTAGVQQVQVSIKRSSDNTYWNGAAWSGTAENLQTATGTTSWTYALAATSLTDGLTYTVHVVARDVAGNTQSSSSYTFTYDTTAPSSSASFPAAGASYNAAGWAAGCATPGLCGTASDATAGLANVKVSIKRSSDDTYWNGSAWSGTGENLRTATGASSWSYGLAGSNLADGLTYTVHVVAADNAGNTQTSSTFTFTYDTTAPSSSATFPAGGAGYNAAGWAAGCATPGFCGTASGAVAGLANVKISVKRGSDNTYWNGSAWSGASENLRTATGTSSWSYGLPASNLSDGVTYTVHVVATDNAGNVETSSIWTFKYDTTAPASTLTFPAAAGNYDAAGWAAGCATAGLCGSASDATGGVANVQVSVKRNSDNTYWNGTAFSGASENLRGATGTTSWSYGVAASNLADGMYTVHVVATDTAGNVETSSTSAFRFDSTAPTSGATFPAAGGAYNALGWAAGCAGAGLCGWAADTSGSGVANVKVSVKRSTDNTYWNGGAFSGTSENLLATTYAAGAWSHGLAAAALTDGASYTVHVVATDVAGNTQTSSTFAFLYDTTPPVTTDNAPPAPQNAAVTVTLTPADGAGGGVAQTQYKVDGGSFTTGTSVSVPAPADHSNDGVHTITYRSTDVAGNVENDRTASVTIDTTAPVASITSTPSSPTSSTAASFSFTADEAVSGFQCSIDGGAFSACASPESYSGLAEGSHTFRVKATADLAGNAGAAAQHTWTIDTTAPSFASATAADDTLTVTLDETLDAGQVPAGSAFTVTRNGSPLGDPTVAVSGANVTLTLPSALNHGDVVTVAYTKPGSGATLRDAAGNEVATFAARPVTNNTFGQPPAAPALASPADAAKLNTATPTLSARFDDPDTNDTGTLVFRVCADAACGSPLGATFSSVSGVANGTNGSAAVPAGRITADGTYYWQAQAKDDVNQASPWSAIRSFSVDTGAPSLQSASATGTTLTLTFDEALDEGKVPDASAFAVTRNGSTLTVTNVSIGGGVVTLTLSAAVRNGDDVDATYTKPGSGDTLRDPSGNEVASFGPTAVTNGTANVAPNVAAPVSPANGANLGTATPTLRATFSDDDTNNTGTVDFRVCSDAACTLPLGAAFSSPSGLANGADGSATVPAGRIAADGTYYWQARSTDNGGASSAWSAARSLVVDTAAPATTDDAPAGWRSTAVTVTLGAGDGSGTGVAQTVYRIDTGSFQTGTSISVPAPADHSNDGVHTITYRSTDAAGNVEGDRTATVRIDTTKPATTDDAPAGWTASPVTVTLSPTDASGTSGVAQTHYKVDGGSWQTGTSVAVPAPADHSSDGVHTITYRATDNAGNVESDRTALVRIDTTAPATTDDAPADWQSTAVTVTLSTGDGAGSGVALTEYKVDGGSFTTGTSVSIPAPADHSNDGVHTITYRSTDAVGNAEADRTATVRVDTTAPTTIDDAPAGWSNGPVLVTFTADDGAGTSGVAQTEYEVDGGSFATGSSVSVSTAGVHTVTYRSTDAAGNVEAHRTATVRIDTTSPSTTDDAPGGWQRTPVTVTLAPADAGGSGLAGTTYRVDGGSWQSGTSVSIGAPADHSNDGTHTITYRSTDAAGNVEADRTATARIDTRTPASSASFPAAGASYTAAGWSAGCAGSGGLCGTASDTGAGLQQIEASIQRSSDNTYWNGLAFSGAVESLRLATGTSSWGYALPLPALEDGVTYSVRVVATDLAGNVESSSAFSFAFDTTAPTTSDDAPAGWSKTPVTLTLTPADATSPVTSTVYSVDGGMPVGGTTVAIPAPADHSDDGVHTITYHSVDAAGNAESDRTATVRIDTTKPATTDDAPAGWSNAAVSVHLAPADGGSGVAQTDYSVDGGPFQTGTTVVVPAPADGSNDGFHTIAYRSTDAAGNAEADRTTTVRIDATKPTTTDDAPAAPSRTAVTVTLSPADTGGSGLAQTQSKVDGGAWQTGTSVLVAAPADHSNDGLHTIAYRSSDDAGNVEADRTATVRIDTTKPMTGDDAPAGWSRTPVTVTLTPADLGGSGVAQTFYAVDGGALAPGTSVAIPAPANHANDGVHTIAYHSVDEAANVEDDRTATVHIDTTKPSTSDDAPAGWSRTPVVVNLTGTDGASGLADTEYSVDGGAFQSGTVVVVAAPASHANDGVHTIVYRSTDNAGNVESDRTATVRIDTTKPTTSDDAPGGWSKTPVTVTLTPSDPAGSGVATTTYEVDGGATQTGTSVTVAAPASHANDGVHTITYRSTDTAGNVEADRTATVQIDTTKPSSSDDAPAGWSKTAVSVSLSSGDGAGSGVATTTYELDGGAAQTGTSVTVAAPADHSNDGVHTITYRSSDHAGNVEAGRTAIVRIDTTKPVTTDDAPAGASSDDVLVTLAPSDAASGIATTTYEVDGGTTQTGTAVTVAAPADHSDDGDHTITYRSTDAAGNVEADRTATVHIDTIGPTVVITSSPATPTSSTSADFEFTSNDGGTTFQCKLDGGSYAPCASPLLMTSLGDGSHTLSVKAADGAGNGGVPTTKTWVVDTTAPTVGFSSTPPADSNSTSASFAFSASEGATYTCRPDSGSTVPCASPFPVTGLGEGGHTFRVEATDPAGNTGSRTYAWTVDTQSPTVSIDSAPSALSNEASPDFAFSSSDGATSFDCRVDGGAWATCTSPLTLTGLGDGPHGFEVRPIDAAGNVGAAETFSWTRDTSAPAVTIADGPADPTNQTGATFTFSSADGGTSFECGVDGGAFASCSSPTSYSGLAAGPHTFRVRAIDDAGNTGAADTATWTIDLSVPSIAITSGPNGLTNATGASFTFTADAGTTVRCSLDGAAFTPCSSPVTFSGLADGPRTVTVRATNTAGTSSTDTRGWTVDTVAPTASLGGAPTASTQADDATLSFSSPDGGTSFECKLDGGAWAPCTSPVAVSALADGPHTFSVRSVDDAGNTGAPVGASWTVDTTAPNATIGSRPADPTNDTGASFTFTADESGTTFECNVDGAGFAACTSPATAFALGDGAHTFEVRAIDAAGNIGGADTYGWTIDTTAPGTSITGSPALLATTATASFTFTSTESGSTFECRLDGGAWGLCPASYAGLAEGSHTFEVRATDPAGNTDATPASFAWTVDTLPPTLTIDNGPSGTVASTSATVDFTAEAAATVTCSLDGGPAAPCTSPVSLTGLAQGAHTLELVATDAAGNTTTRTRGWAVDTVAPSVTVDSRPAPQTASSSASFGFSSPDGGASFECRLDGGAFVSCSSPEGYSALADGPHTFVVRASDAVGNASTDSETWTIDTADPTVSFASPSDGAYLKAATATVAAAASDAGSGVASVELFECTATGAGCPGDTWTSIGIRTSAPYSVSWTLPGDGVRALRAVATDGVGHSTSETIEVTLDQTAPTGSLSDPGAYVRGDVALHATASDATSGVNSVDFNYSGPASGAFASAVGTTYDGTWHTAGLPDGSYDLNVFVTDRATNTFTPAVPRTVLVDNTAPAAAVDDPGAFGHGTIALTATASDGGSGIDATKTAFEQSAAGANAWTPSAAPASWTPADGAYDLRVRVEDRAGNGTTSATRTILVDNTPATTTDDADGAWHRTDVTVHLSPADAESGVASTEYDTGSGWQTGTSVTVPAPGDGSNDGVHTITYRSTNRAGVVEASRTATVKIDATAPTASVDAPGAGTVLRGATDLQSTVSDATSGVGTIAYRVAPAGTSEATPCNTWGTQVPAHLDTTTLADGLYDVRVVAVDNAGNGRCSAFVQNVRVDNTAPDTVDDAPAGEQNHDVVVHLVPTDAGSGVASTSYRLNGGAWQTGTTVTVVAAGHEGENTIEYRSTDLAGNDEAVRTTSVVIDTTAPNGGGANDPGSVLRGDAHLTASPSDGDVASVEFAYRPDGSTGSYTSIGTDLSAPYDVTWDTTSVPDGLYDLNMIVVDRAGNSTVTPLTVKRVDNTSPDSANVTSPAAGAVRSGDVMITATATDAGSGVATVRFEVKAAGAAGFTTVDTDTSAPWSAVWNSRTLADGPAELRVVVTDVAGNTPLVSALRTITIDNDAPTVGLSAPATAAGDVSLGATVPGDVTGVRYERSPHGADTWTTIGTANVSPFGVTWSTGAVADGVYDVRATATDVGGNTGSDLKTMRVDNAAPTSALTAPAAGAVVGGPSVAVATTASDAGVGVAGVTFGYRAAGSSDPWTDIAADATAPYGATWDTTGLASGDYELRVLAADAAGNSAPSAVRVLTVDSTAPTGAFAGLGSTLSGTATLHVTTAGGPTRVAYEVRGTDGVWCPVATSTSAPFSVAIDTSLLADGPYDLRATFGDEFGNASTDVASVVVDNTMPFVVTSNDGSRVDSADGFDFTTSEDLSAVDDLELDGHPVLATPTVSGRDVSLTTGPLGTGAHVVAGTLVDDGGHRAPFRINVTVGTAAANGAVLEIAKNVSTTAWTTLTALDSSATVSVPPASYGRPASMDFLVLHVKPAASDAASVGTGVAPASNIVDVTATWHSTGVEQHSFDAPIQIALTDQTGGSGVPATLEDGRWRTIPRLDGTTLPATWPDGFYRDGSGVHVLTRHLTLFTLLRDVQAPPAPIHFGGVVAGDGLTLRWLPGRDNTGALSHYTLFVDGEAYADYGIDQLETKMGAFTADDMREFTIREYDLAGNPSALAGPLRAVPHLVGLTLDEARAALAARGFTLGTVTEVASSAPAGTVVGSAEVLVRMKGSAIDVQVAHGVAAAGPFTFGVVATKRVPARWATIAARVKVSKPARVDAALINPWGRPVASWRLRAKTGASIVRLRLRDMRPRTGMYTLQFKAVPGAAADRVVRKLRVQVGGRRPVEKHVDVVLALAPATKPRTPAGIRYLAAADLDRVFALAGSRSRNVRAVAIDIDTYGVGAVRTLHAVFHNVRIVASSSSAAQQSQAKRAGATVSVPRTTARAKLVALVDRLARR